MSVARFVADQRTNYRVPHAKTCQWLGLSESWFYKWLARTGHLDGLHTDTDRRRARSTSPSPPRSRRREVCTDRHGCMPTCARQVGSCRRRRWRRSMRRQGLVARTIRRRNGLTRQDKTAPKFPDLVKRDFTADAPNSKWVGDMTEIPTAAGKLYLATVIDLFSRKLLGAATGLHPDAELACQAIQMAVAARGGAATIAGVIFHSDRGSTYTGGHVHRLVPQAADPAVDGTGRVVFRQRLRGSVLLQPGMGSLVPPRFREHSTSPGCRDRVVLRLLQPPAPPQCRRDAVTEQLRDQGIQDQAGSGIGNPPRFRGNHTPPATANQPAGRTRPGAHQ